MPAGRPVGWDVVELDDDPTPGEVSGIRSLSRGYGSIAEAAGEAHRILVRILNDGATASWVGAAGDAFRAKVDDDFPGQVEKCATSYGLARDALSAFAGRVDDAQVKADTNLAKAKTAAEDLASAKDAVAQATGGVSGAAQTLKDQQDLYDRYKHQDPPAGVQVPSAAQLRSVSAASAQAQAKANQAQGDLSDAQSRLDAAKRMVLEAQGDYQDAEDRAVRTLEDAYDAAVPEDSWWVKVIHSKAWHIIVAVVTVLVIVAAIAAFFVTGPLALLLTAVVLIGSGIQLLDDAGKFFNGEESGAEFALAIALTFLPGGKIAKGLEKGVAAATKGIRAGEDVAKGAKGVERAADEVRGGGGRRTPADDAEHSSQAPKAGGGHGRPAEDDDKTYSTDDLKKKAEVNPNYDPADPAAADYGENCGSCAEVVAKRLGGGDESSVAGTHTYNVPQMQKITGVEQEPMAPEAIEQKLRSMGPGAHAVVGIDRASGPGHWFNAYYDGREVRTVDGQTGEVPGWPPIYGGAGNPVVNWDAGFFET